MNDIPANLPYSPNQLDRWLDSQPPLSDDDIRAMSAYFHSESFQFPDDSVFDIIKSQTTDNGAKQNEQHHSF